MLGGTTLHRWQLKSVQDLLSVEGVRLVLIIQDPSSNAGPASGEAALFRFYCRLFVKSNAIAVVNTIAALSETPRLVYEGPNIEVGENELEKIEGYDLDFILKLTDGSCGKDILRAARHGVWSYTFGDSAPTGNPACFWEVSHRNAVTAAALVRITDDKSDVIIRKGFFRTQNSYARNIQLICSEISRWPSQVCRDILNDNAEYVAGPPKQAIVHTSPPPNNRETIRFISKTMANRVRAVYRLLFRYSFWNIGVVRAPIERFLDPTFKPQIDWLPRPPKGEFKADPFGILESPNIHVFYENLDYHAPKGIIYTVQLSQGKFANSPQKMIELPVHMSYPYLVEHEGQLYCVPETNRAREISVYKSTRFPDQWQKAGALLSNVMAIDTTIFQHDGTWWMMFTDREKGGDANLYVWYAQDFWGPWKPHFNNPVKSDVRSARPGGTPFYHDGILYRPAQDCSKTGGGRTVINRVNRLSPIAFDEEEVAYVEPDPEGPYPEGLHTLSKVGDLTLVDGKRFEFSAFALLNNIAKGVRRTFDRE